MTSRSGAAVMTHQQQIAQILDAVVLHHHHLVLETTCRPLSAVFTSRPQRECTRVGE